jgi:hypothetical protein
VVPYHVTEDFLENEALIGRPDHFAGCEMASEVVRNAIRKDDADGKFCFGLATFLYRKSLVFCKYQCLFM